MKFKIGDKVRIVAANSLQPESLIGKCSTIIAVNNSCYKLDCGFWWEESDLALPKFDIKDYPGNYTMHCKTKDASNVFLKYLHDAGLSWRSGDSLLELDYFDTYEDKTGYDFDGEVGYGFIDGYINKNYKILNFEDFDWSDIIMEKKFTKADLKNGDVVKISDDIIGIICLDTDTIIQKVGCDRVSDLTEDLKFKYSSNNARIVAVRRPIFSYDCKFNAFDSDLGELVYERKEVEEMTLEEVCKALGKEIKIVKEKV